MGEENMIDRLMYFLGKSVSRVLFIGLSQDGLALGLFLIAIVAVRQWQILMNMS